VVCHILDIKLLTITRPIDQDDFNLIPSAFATTKPATGFTGDIIILVMGSTIAILSV
jgi:hypothetical protein